ncbi:hypothetical protein [Streptacidiphilus sp. PAMC 29251]
MHVESDPPDSQAPGPGAGTETAATHLTTVVEKGSFSTARCSCGWSAPARRSRDKSRKDAAQHSGQ